MTDVNHIGITVGNIDEAIQFYCSVLDMELLAGPLHCDTTTAGADRRADVFGARWGAMKLAHLSAANGTGIELFEFLAPVVQTAAEHFPYWMTGPHHVAFTVGDFNATLQRILDNGGAQRTSVYDVHGGALICYCEDPWGNIVEIVSTSYRALSIATTV
jgi:catechol 2,3-dioxygenase-like lactoylglutathione lyase family enzyme